MSDLEESKRNDTREKNTGYTIIKNLPAGEDTYVIGQRLSINSVAADPVPFVVWKRDKVGKGFNQGDYRSSLRGAIDTAKNRAVASMEESLEKIPGASVSREKEHNPKISVYVSSYETVDDYICRCGNTAPYDGFEACNSRGECVEPTKDWPGLYRCRRCGALHMVDSSI